MFCVFRSVCWLPPPAPEQIAGLRACASPPYPTSPQNKLRVFATASAHASPPHATTHHDDDDDDDDDDKEGNETTQQLTQKHLLKQTKLSPLFQALVYIDLLNTFFQLSRVLSFSWCVKLLVFATVFDMVV